VYVLTANKRWYPLAHKYRKIWGNLICNLSGLRQVVTFEEKIDPSRSYILAPNHCSYLDIVSTTCGLPIYFNFMAKYELSKVPLFGRFFSTLDISVNRKNRKQAVEAFYEADSRLKNGTSILIFPEGGITKESPTLTRFKPGAFKLAIQNQVPIIPITLLDNHKRLPDGNILGGTPGKMRMIVHRPVEVTNLKPEDENELKQKVYSIIEKALQQNNIS
jgi:1-acyl-sn-glycerol-3-phosphate acyltransferase